MNGLVMRRILLYTDIGIIEVRTHSGDPRQLENGDMVLHQIEFIHIRENLSESK